MLFPIYETKTKLPDYTYHEDCQYSLKQLTKYNHRQTHGTAPQRRRALASPWITQKPSSSFNSGGCEMPLMLYRHPQEKETTTGQITLCLEDISPYQLSWSLSVHRWRCHWMTVCPKSCVRSGHRPIPSDAASASLVTFWQSSIFCGTFIFSLLI